MNTRKMNILTVVLFCGFLFTMTLLYVLLPKDSFSELEKRYLAEPPRLTLEAAASGQWGEDAESYLADHMPGRDFFVGLNAYFDLITGRQKTKDIWVLGDTLTEAPRAMDGAAIRKNMQAVNAFAEKTGIPTDLMIVPSAGWYRDQKDYGDSEIIDAIYAQAGETVETLDLRPVLHPDCFYRTDHHWTSQGAFLAGDAYAKSLGLSAAPDFTVETSGGFRGSAYSRSGLWLTPGETVELWNGSPDLTVEIAGEEEVHEGVFFRENLEKPDQYTVFLGGNHPLVRVHNPHGQGKLLVVRDSFSNSLGCFLAEYFEEVTLVDLRYYKQSVSHLAEQEDVDRILVCYGLGNFLTDQNLIFLNR